ncbi:MAG: DUF4421 domain-containing protein [Flavobacterium sp.]|nr:MAG: DUF4421 domain-containing protein [Flavobacterium sp.]
MGIAKFLYAFLCCIAICCAQDSIPVTRHIDFNDKLTVQLFSLNTSNSFVLNYNDESVTSVNVEPNYKTTLGVSVQYDIISFSFGFAPSFLAENKDNKGSKMVSFSVNAFPGKWMQHFDFYYQKGFTLDSGDASIYLPGLKSFKVGGSSAYLFNREFSGKAIMLQNAKQIRSAGSFAPTLSYYYTRLSGDGEDIKDSVYFTDFALSPAYYYNFVIAKDFMISAGLSVGAGVTLSNDYSPEALYQGSGMLTLGYNTTRFFAGINSRAFVSSHDADGTGMDDNIAYHTIFAGYRFDAPSLLVKEKEKFEKKIKN